MPTPHCTGLRDRQTDRSEERRRVLLINLHGLVRGDQLEIGRDADNGGQIVYLLELAYTLARRRPSGAAS